MTPVRELGSNRSAHAPALPAAERDPGAREEPRVSRRPDLPTILFAFALLAYSATLFVGLTRYPIMFFCDEAVQANTAHDLFQNRFRDAEGVLLPPYFLNDQRWAMSMNIYALVLPLAIFGKSILVTRGTFAVISILGAAATGIALRAMGSRVWWVPSLLLGTMPVAFLHSRWAMETTPAWYAAFLAAYLLYRLRSPRYLFLALALGAATFYSYTSGQGIMLVTGLLLLVVDVRYHFRQRLRLLIAGVLFLAVLAIPWIRERHRHPGSTQQQLRVLDSYWVTPLPLRAKLKTFATNYAKGFDPHYWFQPNPGDSPRHVMKGRSYIPIALLPLSLLGIVSALVRWRSSPGHRVILLAPLGVPFAGAFAHQQILRVLPMTVCVALLAALGVDQLFRWIPSVWHLRAAAAVVLALGLALAPVRLTADALTNGPKWYTDYGLYGLQWGAQQVMAEIRRQLSRSKDTVILLSSTWSNNPIEFPRFFLTPQEQARVRFGDIYEFNLRQTPMTGHEMFVMPPVEYELAAKNAKFEVPRPDAVIPYPDGRPGFYFVRVRYTKNAPEVFQAERAERARPVEGQVVVDGQTLTVLHSRLDMGDLPALFDHNTESLIRGAEANPFLLEFTFPRPRTVSRVAISVGAMDQVQLKVILRPADAGPEKT
ncbi:MAG TPA: hypothetical protein VK780_03030, partial [Thermoanaerobaculia bacterium]|nr:hypothetical protein [Thermoanaerobaculia bacterium]